MKPHLLKVTTGPISSFSVRQNMIPYMNNSWHYHPEVELIHLLAGSGMQFVGDSIMRFNPGDIVLVGANLPHFWRYDDKYMFNGSNTAAWSTAIHFTENFWGDRFLHLPENKQLKLLLEKARRGILISGKTGQKVGRLMQKAHRKTGMHRIIALLKCLVTIAEGDELSMLSSVGFSADVSDAENERINAIYEHSLSHFQRKIQLSEIADIAGMTPNYFCRYFKGITGKTYSQFLIEVRVGYACKLLMDNKLSIKQLCFECGFNNFSCFHKNFKQVMGQTPQSYQKEYSKVA